MGESVRGRVYEPFKANNFAALKHGAWSPRVVDPVAQELVAVIAPTVTWWQECDWPTIWRWAQAEARCLVLAEFLEDRGGDIDDVDESVRPAADLLLRWTATAERLASRLGLDPLSRGRLGRDVASAQLDVARWWASQDDDQDHDEEV